MIEENSLSDLIAEKLSIFSEHQRVLIDLDERQREIEHELIKTAPRMLYWHLTGGSVQELINTGKLSFSVKVGDACNLGQTDHFHDVPMILRALKRLEKKWNGAVKVSFIEETGQVIVDLSVP